MEAPQRTYTIYEISCLDTEIEYTYIGSTQNFTRRKCEHKTNCNNPNKHIHNIKLYTTIRENGGWINWCIKPLEEFICETKQQGHIREQYWVDLKKSKLNMIKAYISEEDVKKRIKDYRIENADKTKEWSKEWREKNAEKIKADKAKYQIENKERISIKRKTKYTCECGSELTKRNKSQHEKTLKHKNYVSMTEN